MSKPELFDVIELLTDIPEKNLKKGEQGAIIEDYEDGVYEIEFCNNYGETIALCPIPQSKFMVVWNSKTKISKVSDQEREECDQFKLKNERKKPKID